MKTVKFSLILGLILLSSVSLWAQPQLIATYPIIFNDDAQRQIDVKLTEPVTITNQNGWTITVNNVSATIIGLAGSGSNIISFQITDNNTPATPGIEFSEKLLVKVSYDKNLGNVNSVSIPVKPLGSFTDIPASNTIPFDCNIFNGIQSIGVTGAPQLCIPITPTLWGEYGVKLSAKNSIYFNASKITVFYSWKDATNKVEYISTVETPAGSGVYRASASYTYPVGGNQCTYTPEMFPVLQVAPSWLSCSGGGRIQKQTFLSYSRDNDASGVLGMTPTVYNMCIGQSTASIIFADATLLNCRLAVEPNQPNQKERRVRFKYGLTGTANRIPNISVNGVPVTDGVGNLIAGEYIDPRNSGLGIVMPEPVTGPTQSTLPISFVSNGNEQVGDEFYITIEYWNPCNPYPFGAVTTTAKIVIVDGPIANAGIDKAICEGSSVNLTGQHLGAVGTSQWTRSGTGTFGNEFNLNTTYTPSAADILAGNVVLTLHAFASGACPEDIDQMTLTIDQLPAIPTISLSAGSNGFCDNNSTSLTLTASASPNGSYKWYKGGVYTGVATQSIVLNDYLQSGNYTVEVYGATSNACPRLSASYTVSIYQMATVTTQPLAASTCDDDNMTTGDASFTVATGGGAHSILWQRQIGAGAWVDITGGTTPNDNCTYADFTTTTLNISSADIGIDGYHYRVKLTTTAGSCLTYSNSATLTVYPVPSFTGPSALTLCELAGGSFSSTVTIASGSITNYQWQRSNGSFSDIIATTDGSIYSGYTTNTLNISSAPESINGYQYRLVATTNNSCQMRSGSATITVNSLADITGQTGTRDICAGENTTFSVTDDGAPAVTAWQWMRSTNSGVSFSVLSNGGIYSGATTGTLSLTNVPAGHNGYQYYCVLTTNGPCTISSSPALLVVHSLPVNRTVNASDSYLCYNTGTNINLIASENSIVYQLRTGVSNIGATQTGNGTDKSFATGNLTASTTFNIYAAKTTNTYSLTKTCYLQMALTPLVTVNPSLTITNLTYPDICLDGTVDLPSATPAGGSGTYTYAWTGTGAYTNTVQNPASFSPSSGTGAYSYTITVTDEGFRTASADNTICTVADAIPFTVNPLPTIGMSVTDPTICAGQTATITIANTVIGTNYQLRLDADDSNVGIAVGGNGGNRTFSVTPSSTTVYNVLATIAATGCDDEVTDKSTVTVNPQPTIATTGTINDLCFSLGVQNATLIYTATTNNPNSYSINWDVTANAAGLLDQGNTGFVFAGGGGNLNSIVITPATPAGTYSGTMTITNGNGCTKTQAVTITINPAIPGIPVITTGSSPVCQSQAGVIYGVVNDPTASNYSWTFTPALDVSYPGATTLNNITVNFSATSASGNVTVIASNGCGSSLSSAPYLIAVNPTPIVTNMATTVCGGIGFTVTPVNGIDGFVPGGTTYSWGVPAGAGFTGGATGTNAPNISGTLTNTTNAVVTASYTVTPKTGACTGSSFTVSVTLNPTPAVSNIASTICSVSSFSVTPVNTTNGIVPAGTTCTWGAPVIAPALSITGGSAQAVGQASISQTLTNTTNASATATYTVTPTSGSCTGATFQLVVTVSPKATISDKTSTICSATVFTVTPANGGAEIVPAGTTYTWGAPVIAPALSITGGSAQAVGQASISQTLTNTTNASATATYTVTPRSGSCDGATFQLVVTVSPKATISDKTSTICSATVFTVTPANGGAEIVPAGTTYTWGAPVIAPALSITGGSAQAVGQASISQTLTNTTNVSATATYTVTPRSGSCDGATFQVTVTVSSKATISDKTSTICSATAFTVTPVNGGAEIVPAGTTYTWGAPVIAPALSITGGSAQAVGQASISQTLTNTTNASATATYTVTPRSGSCDGATFQLVVTVSPKATISDKTSTICSATVFTVTPANGGAEIVPAGTTYTWGAPVIAPALSITGGSAQAVGQASISQTLTNTTNASATATYTVTPRSGSCDGATFQVTVTVSSKATISDKTSTICSATAFTVTPVNGGAEIVPAGTTYTWGAPVIAPALSITGGSAQAVGQASISQSLTNITNASATATYTVTPTSGSCTGATFDIVVTVSPKPAVTDMTGSACSAEAFGITPVNLTNGLVPAGTTYSWPLPVATGGLAGGAPSSGTPVNINGTLTNPTNVAQTATYIVTPTTGTCVGANFTVIVTVNPKPAVTNMTATTCNGVLFTALPVNGVNGVVPAGTTYSWPAPSVTGGMTGGAPGTNAADISGTITNTTNLAHTATYIVTPSVGGCSGATFTVIVTVNPGPAVTDMATAVCTGVGFNQTPVNGTNGTVPPATTYTWPIPVVTGGLTGGVASVGTPASISGILVNPTNTAQTATYSVTPAASGCTGTPFSVIITVNPAPVIANKTAIVCSATLFTVSPVNGTDLVPGGTTYSWPIPVVTGGLIGAASGSGAANISGTLNNPTNTAQTATYTVTPLSGTCSGAAFTVTVTVDPKPAVTLMTATVCSSYGFTATPANGTNGIVPIGTTYSWAAPVVTGGMTGGTTGSGAANIGGTLTNTSGLAQTATYTVTPLSGSCTGANFFVIVTVNPLPAISAIAGDPILCDNAANEVYQVVNHGGSTYAWSVPIAPDPLILDITFDAGLYFILVDASGVIGSGDILVKETITATGCFASAMPFNVTVSPVAPGLLVTGPVTACQGAAGVVYSVPDNGGSTYAWSVPPGTSITTDPDLHEIQVTFGSSGGNVSVIETALGGCVTIHTPKTITVNPTPSITNMNSTICSGGIFTAAPANGTNGTVPVGTTYTWPLPVVTGGITGGATGAAAASISGTLVNPTSTFQTATYTVTPVTGTCTGATFTVTVLVNPIPAVSNMTATICSAGSFTATPVDATNGTVPAGTIYTWLAPAVTGGITGGTPGTNAAAISGTLTNPTNTVQTATYTVTPKSGSCTGAIFTVTVTINPKPAVSNMTATICSAGSFTAAPSNGVNGIVPVPTTYTWSAPSVTGGLNGGAAGTAAADISGALTNPTNTTQIAIYTVTPTAGGCTGADFTVTITVNPMPSVTAMVNNACSGAPFTSAPSNGVDGVVPIGTTYTWPVPVVTGGLTGFAAGTTAANISGTLTNPTNLAQTATYTVTPTSGSCTGFPFTVTVTVDPKPAITNMTETICSTGSFVSAPLNLTNGIVPAATTYTWAAPAVTGGILGGDAGTNTANITGSLTNPTNTAQTAIYTVTPKSGSCTGTPFLITVTVDPKPTIPNMAATICSGSSFISAPVDGTNGIVPVGTTYTWGAPVIAPALSIVGGGAQALPQANISQTLTNVTNAVATATYTVTPVSGLCTGATFTVTITVNPMPGVTNMTRIICSGGIFSEIPADGTNGIVPAGTTYTWPLPVVTGGVTGGLAGTNLLNITGTLTNPTNAVQTATYTVTPKAGSCTGATFTVIVTVNPKPAVTNMTATICSAGSFTTTPASGVNGIVPGTTTYTWAVPTVTGGITGGAAGTGAANISGTLVNPTNAAQTATYTVTPATPDCTGATFTVIITVDPKPAVASLTATTCSDGTFTTLPVNGFDGIVPFGTTYTWPAPVVTGGITGEAAGTAAANISGTLHNPANTAQTATYTVTPTAGGCAGTAFTVIVTVNPMPAVTDMATTICSTGSFVSVPLNVANGVVPAGTTYTWPAPVVTGSISGGAAGTSAANISGTLSNPTNSAQTATYTVTPKSGSCSGATFTLIVTVDPKPAVTNMTATICSGSIFTAAPVNGVNGVVPAVTTYTWGDPVLVPALSITGGSLQPLPQANISQTLTNVTNAVATATYTVTPVSGLCTGATFTVTITVNPMPAVTDMVSTICSGGSFASAPLSGTNGIVPAGTTYSWPLPVVTGGITGIATGTNATNITGTLTNPTNILQTATYTVTPKSGSCTGATFQVVVTVNAKATITPMTATICSAGAFTSVPTDGVDGVIPAGTTYSWPAPVVSGGLTGGAAGAAAINISGTLTNPTNSAQTAIYTVTPLSGGCTGASFTVTVTVNPMPAITDMTAIVCSDGTFTKLPADGINGIVPAATTYTWVAPAVTGGMTGGAPGGAAANISGTLNNPTNVAQTATYTVFPTSGSCSGVSFKVTVTVSPKPVITDMVSTICSGGSFASAPLSGTDGIVPVGTTYTWPSPVVTGGITGGASGTGVPNISGTLNNPTNTAQTATYTVTPVSGSCTGATFKVTITVDPKPAITNMTAVICSAGTFTTTPVNTTNGIVPAATGYTWGAPTVTGGLTGGLAGAGAIITGMLTNPTSTQQIAIYTVTPLAGTCTGNDFTVTVTVNPVPAVNNLTTAICSAGTFTTVPANAIDGVVPTGTTYTWLAPVISGSITGGAAGTAAANISGTLTNTSNTVQTATYTVTPVTGTCTGADFSVVVTVNPKPAVTNMTALICGGGTFTAAPVNITNGLVPAGTTYTWPAPAVTGGLTGGAAGTAAANISGTLVNPTNTVRQAVYTVTPTAGGCTGPNFTVTVTVDPTPAINAMTATTCSGTAFTSTPVNLTNGIVPGGTTYTWVAPVVTGGLTGGAGGLGASITGTLVNSTNTAQTATYTVIPTAGSCTGTSFIVTVTVSPVPAVTPMTSAICSGGSFTSTPVNVTDGIVPAGTTYSWTAPAVTGGVTGGFPGSGLNISGTLTNPTNALQTATYTVTPTSGSCTGADFTVTVTVNPKPAVTNMIATICSGGSFVSAPLDGTNGVVPVPTTYTWAAPTVSGGITGGAAGTAAANISGTLTNPTNTPQTAVYTVTPTAGSCTGATFTVIITVDPKPSVTDMTAIICSGSGFISTPLNVTNGIVPAGTTYTWGPAVVTGGVTGGIAGAGISITGTLVNPTNVVQTATYTVTPTSGTCTGSTFNITVTVNPKPGIAAMTAIICSGGSFTSVPVDGVNGIVPAATTYSWAAPLVSGGITGGAAGSGAVNINGTLSNPTNTVQTATYTVTPVTGGCTGATFTVTVTVDPKPAIINMTVGICSIGTFLTTPVNLTNGIVPAGTTYTWPAPTVTGGLTGGVAGGGVNITGTLSNPTNAPQIAVYTVTPTAGGCTGATFTVTVTVDPTPAITPMSNTICSSGSFALTPLSGTNGIVPIGTTYTWTAPAVTGSVTGGIAGSGASISGTLINPTSVAQTATYTVTPTLASCTGPAFTLTVTVDPKPAVTAMTATICSGGSFTAAPADGVNGIVPAGTTYTWPVPVMTGGLTGGALGTSAINISGTLTNPTNSPQTATYTVTPVSGGCTGATFTVTVTVNPMPGVSNMSATICSGGLFALTPQNITNGVVPFGTTYSWTAPLVTGGMTGGVAGSGPDIIGTLTNPTNTVQTAIYTVTPTSGACVGSTFTVTISVNPIPAVTAMAATICNTASFTATPANGTDGIVPAGTTYSWALPVVTGGMSGGVPGSGTTITGTLFNTTLTVQTATYTVTPVSGGCTGAPFTMTVTVNPSTGPTSFETGAPEVCQDGPDETYIAKATNSTSILYSVLPATAGTINATTGIMDWAPSYYGNATITATAAGLCGTTVGTITVRVKRLPSIATSPVAAVTCEFGQVNFDVTANGDDLSYQWEVDPNTGSFAPVSGGIYSGIAASTLQIWSADRTMNNYKYRVVVSGCLPDVTSASALLTVNTAPELTVHPKDSVICLGAGTTMNAASLGTGIVWTWYVNKGTGGFVPVVADTHFSFATTISSDTTKTTLTITDALATYNNWIFRAQAKGTCGAAVNTNFARLSVTNPPVVALQPVLKVICENGSTSFLGNGSGYQNLKWQVSTNSGTSWTNIVDDAVTYVGAATNQLSILNAPVTLNNNLYRLALKGACTIVYSNGVTLTVNPNPIVNFVTDLNACGGVPLVLNGNPSGGTLPYTQHRWTGDVGPLDKYTVQSPTFSSQISGTYTLNYKVTDSKGCTANDDLVVIVDSPAAEFTNDIENGCTPLPVVFTKDMTGIAKFWWDFNDGTPVDSIQASPAHTFVNKSKTAIGYYNVKLKVLSPGGCIKTYSSLVTVYPAIKATFTATTDTICSGKSITFTGVSGASKYFWEFGDGVSAYAGSNSTHLYVNPGPAPMDLNVKLTTTSFYSCNADTTIKIVVMPVPDVQFSADPVTQIYKAAGNPVSFNNLTNAGNWTYLWNFDDGKTSTDKNPSHTYSDLGDYEVTLEVTNGSCTDKVMHEVRVTPIPPVASFDSIPPACEPLSVTFNNTSLNTETPGTTYFWEFGDGGISTAKNPEYTYFDPGIYVVKLTVRGPGGADDAKRTIYVNASPKAYFEVAPLFVFVNDEKVRGFNLSQGADYYVWEFGDGDTSHVKEPFHKYMEAGVFDITLSAYSNNGCYDKYILSPGVTVEPAGDIRFSTVFTPNKDGEIDGNMDNVNSGNMDMFFYPPIQEKVQKYKLQIFNRLGVLLFESRNINNAWNGYYKGKLCPQGVYIWYVEGKYNNGEPFKKVGDVTLLH